MILYYALGGGLGHQTRARRVLRTLGLHAAIVTATPDREVTHGIEVIEVPRDLEGNVDTHREWLRAQNAERIIADTFPGGIQGELCGLDVPMDYVARLLRWDEYRRGVRDPLPRFDTTWIVEPLTSEHEALVHANSGRVVTLDLQTDAVDHARVEGSFWLIVHSGPADEVQELVAHAAALRALDSHPPQRVLVATRSDVALPDGFERTDVTPACLFQAAERIVSAAGFNVMRETERWRHKHTVVPFARRFDDQYARAARRRSRSCSV